MLVHYFNHNIHAYYCYKFLKLFKVGLNSNSVWKVNKASNKLKVDEDFFHYLQNKPNILDIKLTYI